MTRLGCDVTAGLVDLLLSPDGSRPFYHHLVPSTHQNKSEADRLADVWSYCRSYGLSSDTIQTVVGRGFVSLQLLALLPLTDVRIRLPAVTGNQLDLLRFCISTLDPRPEYQISQGLLSLNQTSCTAKMQLGQHHIDEGAKKCSETEENPEADENIKNALNLAEATKKVLECPVCYTTCLPPRIWQCENGHLTCASCQQQTSTCPLCRSAFSNIRPIAAESLACQIPLPCKNTHHGCKKSFIWREKEAHESSCDFAVGYCPILSCSEILQLKSMTGHLAASHHWSRELLQHRLTPGSMRFESSISTNTHLHSLPGQQNWWWGPQAISYQNYVFFFLISRTETVGGRGSFYLWLWTAANRAETRRFVYTVTVKSQGEEKLSYSGCPVTLEVGPATIREEQMCLLLSDAAVKRMIGNSTRLHYAIHIQDKLTAKSGLTEEGSDTGELERPHLRTD